MSSQGAQADGGGRQRLPRTARITTSDEIRALFKRGKRKRTRHLDVFFAASPVASPRWGHVVPKHKRTAVQRNRLKRRLREIARVEVLPRLAGCGLALDVMARARPEAYTASFQALRDELLRVVDDLCSSDS